MSRLRELNFIVNKSPFVRKRVCFIYAIRNEIFFDAEQRLKFFDFVISVMPYASQHSAYGYLLENKKQICSCSKFSNSHISMKNSNSSYIETTSSDFCFKFLFPFYKRYHDNVPSKNNLYAQLLNKIDDDFFLEIGSFIKDSRLISNVFNEFFVFCDMFFHNLDLNDLNKTLNDYDELFSRKLFSYALLKNLYPSEYRQFTYSEKSKIDIADVFIKKSTYISQIRELFLNKKNNFEQKICCDLKSLLESDDVNALRKVKENWLTSILGNNWYEFFSLYESISFDNGKKYLNLSSIFSYDFSPDTNWENNNVYFERGYSYNSPYRSDYVVKNVENIIGLLSSIKNHQLSTIKSQIDLLQNYLSKLDDSFLLKDLLELCDNSKKFHDNQINTKLIEVKLDIKNRVNNDFIFFLIRKGYLSEDYPHFLSHNSNITVSSSDQVFIRSMIMNEPLDSSLHLHNIHNILKQIPEDCFGHMSILNFELFDYLVLNEYKYNSKLQKIISSFDKFGEDGVYFLFKFCFSFKKVKIISEPLLQCLF
ncbi:hypothetical protein [Succinivibrio dextrinosolvens]|uniref:YobI family P-loop NTPase n=1 Tax=Succinivibrio dextrinosolvens TaxID=83771 RepID=UPI0012DD01ED|nr:hypothetical protein [Succinivibrio dextrinosolvens]